MSQREAVLFVGYRWRLFSEGRPMVSSHQVSLLNTALGAARRKPSGFWCSEANTKLKGLILAQNERWRRGLGMQVERAV